MAIAIFFVVHSTLSVFTQTFFLHRYGAHRMFKMSRGWERFFYLLTYLTQGSSFLVPKAYAVLHRMHHAYSDTPRDPHSPRNYSGLGPMMMDTKNRYHDLAYGLVTPEPRFDGGYPEWKAIDRLGQSWAMRAVWGALDNGDDSRNTLVFDFITLGELFQNNHHKFGQSPSFAVRWFEIDPTYQVMRVLAWLKIIDFGERAQVARLEPRAAEG